jgi:hypothetical protein
MALLSEKQLLIRLAVTQFNYQFGKSFDFEAFEVRGIPVRASYDVSYEIYTTRLDDNLRLHIHLRFEKADGLFPFRMELDSTLTQLPGSTGSLSDEVFTAYGSLDSYYKQNAIYGFQPVSPTTPPVVDPAGNYALLENGEPVEWETGGFVELEAA